MITRALAKARYRVCATKCVFLACGIEDGCPAFESVSIAHGFGELIEAVASMQPSLVPQQTNWLLWRNN